MEEFQEWLKELVDEVYANTNSVIMSEPTAYDEGYIAGYKDALQMIMDHVEEEEW